MVKIRRSKWGSFWCWFFGEHLGNVQWGEDDPKNSRKTIHKCSYCWRPAKEKKETNDKT